MAKAQKNTNYFLIVIIAFVVIYASWWLYTNIEFADQEPESIPTVEAIITPYLALSEFLDSKEYSVKHNVSWAQLDEINLDDTDICLCVL